MLAVVFFPILVGPVCLFYGIIIAIYQTHCLVV